MSEAQEQTKRSVIEATDGGRRPEPMASAISFYLTARRDLRDSATNLHEFMRATRTLYAAFADGAECGADALAIAFHQLRAALADIQDGKGRPIH